MTLLKLTKIPQLNSIVIKQEGGHIFIAAPDSFIIDKDGLLKLIEELGKIEFVNEYDLRGICHSLVDYKLNKEKHENKENGSDIIVG